MVVRVWLPEPASLRLVVYFMVLGVVPRTIDTSASAPLLCASLSLAFFEAASHSLAWAGSQPPVAPVSGRLMLSSGQVPEEYRRGVGSPGARVTTSGS